MEVDDGTPIQSLIPPIGDPNAARGIFQGIQLQPTVLRVDTFPVCHSPVFSTQLTAFHFFAGNYFAEYPTPTEWYTILSSAPNLVELRLWHPRHGDTTSIPCEDSVSLPLLKRLDLTGLFVRLCGLFTRSPSPNLNSLLLDSLDPRANIPQQIADIAGVSPRLEHLSIGSMAFCSHTSASARWARPFQVLRSLQTITFIETEWDEVVAALKQLDLILNKPVHVRLERIYGIVLEDIKRAGMRGNASIFSAELVYCMGGTRHRCNSPGLDPCRSERGSNYSDGSSISYIFESTSEESGSEEYEYSSDEWYSGSESEGSQDN